MTKIKIISFVMAFAIVSLVPQTSFAQQAVSPNFNPNRLVEDSVFSNASAMNGASAIQRFLEDRNSILANTNNSFLLQLKEPINNQALKTTLEDPGADSTVPRTAAQLIWDASRHSGINPQVILVTLQKEQSLVTGRQNATAEQLQRALDFSMGFGCPDSQPCGELYRGFYYQLFGNVDAEANRYLGAARSLMRSFNTPGGRGPFFNGAVAKIGDTIIISNTLGGYAGVQPQQFVTLDNSATAALYRYTPHVFNGNYNFWRYMTEWFGGGVSVDTGPPLLENGSLVSYNGNYYMIMDGKRLLITDFIMKARDLNTRARNISSLSNRDANSYPDGGKLGLPDNQVLQTETGYYVFFANKLFEATESMLSQRGLSAFTAMTAKDSDLTQFQPAEILPPKEGAVLRGINGPAVYVVENAQLRLVSALVFAQRNLASQIQLIPDAELEKYPKGGFVAPLDGTMVKSPSDPTVSLIADRIKRPIPSVLVFRTYGKTFADIATISDDELTAIPTGALAEAKDNTYYRVSETRDLYVYRNGSRHYIAAFVATQRGITPDLTLSQAEVAAWPEGEPIFPREGTLIKASNSPAVYILEGGQLKALSGADFTARGLSFANILSIPPADLQRFLATQS